MKHNLQLLKSKPVFLRVLIALFLSGLGSALTSIAVYQEFSQAHASPVGFAIVFAAGLLPGFLTSWYAGSRAHKWNIGKTLIFGQLFGLVALLVPLLGHKAGNTGFLIFAEVAASAVSGFLLPVYKGLQRSSFSEEQFQFLAPLDTLVLTANFILGQGIGAILSSHLSLQSLLVCDALTYLLALIVLLPLRNCFLALSAKNESDEPRTPLSRNQKATLFILPWLALTCAPPMILLPARAAELSTSVNPLGLFVMSPVVLVICCRTLGQIVGPLLAARFNLPKLSAQTWALPLSLSFYLGFYSIAYYSRSIVLIAASVVSAHVASNIVYTVGNYRMLTAFSATEMIWASSWVYRASTLLIGLSGLLMGWASERFGLPLILASSALSIAVGCTFIFKLSANRN